MAEEPALVERVRTALEGTSGVTEQRMFGSLGFLVDGTLRLGVGTHPDHVMMVRTGPRHSEAIARAGATPALMRGREMTGWVFLERAAVADDADLQYWVSVALASVS